MRVDLQVEITESGESTLVAVTGELDALTAGELDGALEPLLADPALRGMVVDLSGVDFMDSSGLGICIKAIKGVREKGAEVSFVVTSARVRRVFEITGIDQAVVVAPDVATALAVVE